MSQEKRLLEDSLTAFKEEYLKNRREVNIYRKLKKYSKYGTYLTFILAYFLLAVYISSDFRLSSSLFIGLAISTPIAMILTVLFRLNRRSYVFDEYDLVYHEVADLIDIYEESPNTEELSKMIDRFESIAIEEDDGVIPKIWRVELSAYFAYLDETDDQEFYDTFESVFKPLVETLSKLDGLELQELYHDGESSAKEKENQEPGFLSIVVDSITSDVISKEMVIWGVFILAVGGGLILAFVQGQGWGVLLVTIVFGGLRLYDQQRE